MNRSEDHPAFPRDHRHQGHNGMSLRDYFAGQALSGLLANPKFDAATSYADLAAYGYNIADAMLAVRAKGGDA